MADIGVSVDRPAFAVAVSVTPPPGANVGVQLVRPQVSVEVTRVGEAVSSDYPGSGDYAAATVNETLTALISRKVERSEINLETQGGVAVIDAGLL